MRFGVASVIWEISVQADRRPACPSSSGTDGSSAFAPHVTGCDRCAPLALRDERIMTVDGHEVRWYGY
ncbi:MAG: hypothetical protein QF749_14245, partial [Verrucomicrobiota bacterium]|nr:hypothetical protein [Verrucomicrobiota bacterium]